MTDSREVLLMISKDMADDAKAFYGRPFNGATVGDALGNIQAAVARIAQIVAEMQSPTPDAPTVEHYGILGEPGLCACGWDAPPGGPGVRSHQLRQHMAGA